MSQRSSKLIIPDAEFIGRFPVRTDIEVLPADKPSERKLGWAMSEVIGISIVNPAAVFRARMLIRRTYDEWVEELHKCGTEQAFREMITREAKSHNFDGLEGPLQDLYPQYLPIYRAATIMK